jgi:uncharacterized LabA/DUF88 family protein
MVMERVVVFIDGSNFYHSCVEALGDYRVDFEKFCGKLTGERELVEIRYYIAILKQQKNPEAYKAQQRFLSKLGAIKNLKVIPGKLKKRFDECEYCGKKSSYHVEKGTDVNLAIDLIDLAHKNKYDTAILVTGDGDFSGAVKLTRKFKKKVEHARFEINYSSELNRACNTQTILDEEYMKNCFLTN